MSSRETRVSPNDGTRSELASLGADWARLSSEWYRRATAWSWLATRWASSGDARLRGASKRADVMSQHAHRMVAHLRGGAMELLDLAAL